MTAATARFITLEGIEGAGKSTALRHMQQWLEQTGISYVATREPGGTEIAEDIRQLLLRHHEEPMNSDAELLLMFASRAQHLAQFILPALQRNQWVICDRFTDASYAYQGGGRGIDVAKIAQLETLVQGQLRPDRVFLLDLPAELGMQRISRRRNVDRIEIEKTAFFERVRQAYLSRAQQDPARYRVIDASRTINEVQQRINEELETLRA